MAIRYYANAPATTLAASCSSSSTSIEVASVSGLPIQYPYTLIIDRGLSTEEVVDVTNASGTTLTVTRGADSTTAFAHSNGGPVVHGISARDPREANEHANATGSVHGVTGDLVGTTDTQTLTNKTLGATNTINGFTASKMAVTDGSGKLAAGTSAPPTGTVVGTSDTQTLTNKTISADSNTINGLAASSFVQTTAAGALDGAAGAKTVPAGTVVGTTDTQTLTNKTLSTGTKVTSSGTDLSAAWTAYTPTWTGGSPSIGNGTLTGAYQVIGKTVHFRAKIVGGTTTNFGSGLYGLGIPFAVSTNYTRLLFAGLLRDDSAGNDYPIVAIVNGGATTLTLKAYPNTAGNQAINLTSTQPVTLAAGDSIEFAGTYEID